MEPKEDSSLSPRRPERPIGAQELPARVLGPRQTPPARAAGPQVTTGGAGAPRDLRPHLFQPPSRARAFPAFPGRSWAWTLKLEGSGSLIALPIAAWGRGAPHLETSRTFLSRSLSFGACKTFKDLLILIPRALELY